MITWTNERRKLRDLIPWEQNPREINTKEAQRLGDSLEEFGQIQTIAIGPDNEVYDGHQRKAVWSLLPQFGPDHEVDVRVSSRALTDKERQRLVVYLHRGTKGDWDWDALANTFEVPELLEWGFEESELQLDWGKDATPDPGAQVDKAAELQEKWNVERGQIWQVGRHRVMCGDSTCAEDVGRLMGGERATAVVTDPPYGIEREGIANDDPEGLRALFDGCLTAMPIDNAVVIAFQSPRLFPVWLDASRGAGHQFERALWFYDETDVCFPWHGWLMTSQIALVSSKGQPAWAEGTYHHDCYVVKTAGKQEGTGGHTTAKPLDVVRDLLEHTVGPAYEPFTGSGTTLVACEQTGRIGYGMEICEKYVAVTLERLTGLGLEAHLVGG